MCAFLNHDCPRVNYVRFPEYCHVFPLIGHIDTHRNNRSTLA